jgi:hypothetical protein
MSISATGGVRAATPTPTPNAAGDPPLEPKTQAPTPSAYHPSVGGWIGYGAGALGMGAVGAALGGLGGMLLSGGLINGSGGAALGGAVIGALAAGGIGTAIFYGMNSDAHAKAEQAKIEASFGVPILPSATDMVQTYDHDHSGSVDLVNPTGLPGGDERVATDTRVENHGEFSYDWWDDDVDYHNVQTTVTTSTSAAKPFTAADADPTDGKVTPLELAKLMARFDTDRSGTLTTREQEAFRAEYPLAVETR